MRNTVSAKFGVNLAKKPDMNGINYPQYGFSEHLLFNDFFQRFLCMVRFSFLNDF